MGTITICETKVSKILDFLLVLLYNFPIIIFAANFSLYIKGWVYLDHKCYITLEIIFSLIKDVLIWSSVMHFDQQTGASHAVCWPKTYCFGIFYIFSHQNEHKRIQKESHTIGLLSIQIDMYENAFVVN